MKAYQIGLLAVFAACLLLASPSEAKRRKHKGDDHHHHDHHDHHHDKTKTKTKWSTSTDLAGNTQVSTEEHGYYVKRTYAPSSDMTKKRQCPNFLAIPIAWFSPAANAHMMPSINSAAQSLSEGYLCDDDCVDLYEPICGKTPHEVAVFYNQCKLNVAKCRSHGLWTDFAYELCQQTYPKETAYADKKFKASPFYRDNATQAAEEQKEQENKDKDKDQEMDNSSDSSEENQNHKSDTPMEPLVLPLVQEAASIPVPMESVAMPPMPVKTSTQGPLLAAMSTVADVINAKVTEAVKATNAHPAQVMAKEEHPATKVDQDKLKYLVA